MRRILRGLDWGVAALVIFAMTGMVTIVTAQVVLRYGFNSSLDWAEEVSRLLFVWSVFLAVPLGIGKGSHVGVDLLTSILPQLLRNSLFRLMSVMAMLLMGVVAWQAWILVLDQWDEPLTTLDLPVSLFMLPVMIGAGHSILHLIMAAFDGPPVKAVAPE